MTIVKFYPPDKMINEKFIYSVVAARYMDKWVYVRHHKRNTFEIPGGHIEEGETPVEAAGRELMEETGALRFNLICISTYSVSMDEETRYGKLYFAEISEMAEVPDVSEIEEIQLLNDFPDPVTYPDIQPVLFKRVEAFLKDSITLNQTEPEP